MGSSDTKVICGDPKVGTKGVISPITYSDDDTPETVAQAKENNAVWKSLCGKKASR